MGKWDAHRADIQRMVEAGMTDVQIGAEYGKSGQAMFRVRKNFGIPTGNRPGRIRPEAYYAAKDPAPEPLVGETYVDKAGLTITRYPARYAEGALIQSCTARPRRG